MNDNWPPHRQPQHFPCLHWASDFHLAAGSMSAEEAGADPLDGPRHLFRTGGWRTQRETVLVFQAVAWRVLAIE